MFSKGPNRRRSGPLANCLYTRVCRERRIATATDVMLDGSSPRVRGTRNHLVAVFSRCRFIPACAGNAISGCRARARPTVHPRVCGERLDPVNWVLLIVGSSPSVRGTPKAILDPFRARRFIPACAGNAIRSLTGRPDAPVHPRVCGERIKRDCRRMIRDGSSPRVRGTLNVHRLDKFHCRFIPACAGNASQLPL